MHFVYLPCRLFHRHIRCTRTIERCTCWIRRWCWFLFRKMVNTITSLLRWCSGVRIFVAIHLGINPIRRGWMNLPMHIPRVVMVVFPRVHHFKLLLPRQDFIAVQRPTKTSLDGDFLSMNKWSSEWKCYRGRLEKDIVDTSAWYTQSLVITFRETMVQQTARTTKKMYIHV